MFDLVTTIMLLGRGFGEGNAFFAFLLGTFGPVGFIVGKLAFTVGPILMIEYARTKRPESAEAGAWIAFLLYFFLYVRHIVQAFWS